MNIVKMDASHISQIAEIEKNTFSAPWSEVSLKRELDNDLACYFVAEDEGEVLAYGGMWLVVTEAQITNIAVREDKRRQGLGTLILKKLLEEAKQRYMMGVTLEVRVSNEKALSLYTKNGFVSEGVRKNYYEDNEDAYIMWHYFTDPESEAVEI